MLKHLGLPLKTAFQESSPQNAKPPKTHSLGVWRAPRGIQGGHFGETKSLGSLALFGGDVLNICSLWKKKLCIVQQKRLVETSQTLTLLSRIKTWPFRKRWEVASPRSQHCSNYSSLPYQAPLQDFPAMLEKRSLWIYVRVFWFMIECWKTRVN